ncbi:CVNH domain-containing protein [Phlyctema vagabunda]|uniref:CVNH domain-containing protein n=1 Tax=Phlyctema vagabunda TaxID=108571 RepID=A0ABR4P541_9HELO
MSFHLSGAEFRIEDNHILRARLANEHGEHVDAEIDLDQFVGNSDGSFEWGSSGFSSSAENVSFQIEGGGQVPVLRASLRNVDGEFVERDLNLSERVENRNGQFVYV